MSEPHPAPPIGHPPTAEQPEVADLVMTGTFTPPFVRQSTAEAASPTADRRSFDELLAAADEPGRAVLLSQVLSTASHRSCRVCGCTDVDCSDCIARTGQPCSWVAADLCSACPPDAPSAAAEDELVPGLTVKRAAAIARAIGAHADVAAAAAGIVAEHLAQRHPDLEVAEHRRLGYLLGYRVQPLAGHSCRLRVLWTVHDVQLVTYAPVIVRRPGMPEWEVASVIRFEAHPGRDLSPAVVAAAAVAVVDALEVA